MIVSPNIFPLRKRRPSAGAFVSPKLTDVKLVESLLELSREVSSLEPLRFLLKRRSVSIIRKLKLFSVFFEEILRNPVSYFPHSALLCFEEMYIVFQRIKTLLEDCSNGSKMWLLMQVESTDNSFHDLTLDLWTLLDIFPVKNLDLSKDVEEIVALIRKQSAESRAIVDQRDAKLRCEVLTMLDWIRKGIAPENSTLKTVFQNLGLRDGSSCGEEIERLEEEIQNQIEEKAKSDTVTLISLVRYAKCVLFGSSAPKSDNQRRKTASKDVNIPADFRCPITLELMQDPVVVATGQTYDRESIKHWIESGHNTCPKTGQTLAHTSLIPNGALRNLIAIWCRQQKIPFETAADDEKPNCFKVNKAAVEATKMTVSFLVNKLSTSEPMEVTNGVVYELRVLAKTGSDSRTSIAEAGAIPMLVRYLGSDVGSEHPNLQVNAVTTILNLSILEGNKTRIMETDGALNGVIEVLRSGATWEAKGNAAATISSLCSVHAYRKKLGRKTRVIKGLIDLAKDGPKSSKKDALVAISSLAGDREAVAKLVDGGVVEMVNQVIVSLQEEAVPILESVVKRGGIVAVAAAYNTIRKLSVALRQGSDNVRESSAAALVTICTKGGSEMVAELAGMPGIERIMWELMGTGTARARRKAATLLKIVRRWTDGLQGVGVTEGFTVGPSTAIMLHGY
ncbi:hypothetical protein SLE2022_342120 [Rubroshorea leprosula]